MAVDDLDFEACDFFRVGERVILDSQRGSYFDIRSVDAKTGVVYGLEHGETVEFRAYSPSYLLERLEGIELVHEHRTLH